MPVTQCTTIPARKHSTTESVYSDRCVKYVKFECLIGV